MANVSIADVRPAASDARRLIANASQLLRRNHADSAAGPRFPAHREAKCLVASSALTADDSSPDVGYQDAPSFGRLFNRPTGLAPVRYRRMFRRIESGVSSGSAKRMRGSR